MEKVIRCSRVKARVYTENLASYFLYSSVCQHGQGAECHLINKVPSSFECRRRRENQRGILEDVLNSVNSVSYHWKAHVFIFPKKSHSLQSNIFE